MNPNKTFALFIACWTFGHSAALAQIPLVQDSQTQVQWNPSHFQGELTTEKINLLFPKETHQGQEKLAVGLRPVLLLALTRARSLKGAYNQLEAAQLNADAESDVRLTWTNSASQSNSIQGYGAGSMFAGSNFVTLMQTQSQVLSSSLNHQTQFGLSYGVRYQRLASDSLTSKIVAAGDNAADWTQSGGTFHQSALVAEVKMPLWQDFGMINAATRYQAEIRFKQAQIRYDQGARFLIQKIGGIYWDLVEANENLETLTQAKAIAEKFHQESTLKLNLGLIGPSDLTQSTLALAMAEQNLLRVHIRKQGIEDQMRAALDIPNFTQPYFPKDRAVLHDFQKDYAALVEKALATDPEMNLIRTNLALTQIEFEKAANRDRSRVDLSATYQLNGFGSDPAQADKGFNDPNLSQNSVSLVWVMPLFDGRNSAREREQALNVTNLEMNLADRKAQVEVELQGQLRTLASLEKSIQLTQTSVKLNRELLDKETQNFEMGNSTSYRLSQAQQDLANAQLEETKARIQYEKAFVALLSLTGQLYEHYQIKKD